MNDTETQLNKPIVWVKPAYISATGEVLYYNLSNSKGEVIPVHDYTRVKTVEGIQKIFEDAEITVEVRVWEPAVVSLPVVWVTLRTHNHPNKSFMRIDENGELLMNTGCATIQQVEYLYKDIAEVRVWEPPKPEFPRNAITDGEYHVGVDFTKDGITTIIAKTVGDGIEIIDEHHIKKSEGSGGMEDDA